MIRYLLLFLFILIGNTNIFSQIIVTEGDNIPPTWSVDSLVRNIFVDENIEIANAKFNGLSFIQGNAIGIFKTGDTVTNLGISEGIILGTGGVSLAASRDTSMAAVDSFSICRRYNTRKFTSPFHMDYPLQNIIKRTPTDSIYNCAVLEFEFKPNSDYIQFRYVFASMEYPSFVCSNINDVFALFLSGPNPDGTNYIDSNIAKIPGTDYPVTINFVNGGNNGYQNKYCTPPEGSINFSHFYVDNSKQEHISHTGFTTVFTASANVIPCQTYKIRIAIADVNDECYDSSVFLESYSFESPKIDISYQNTIPYIDSNVLYKGCNSIDIVLKKTFPANTDQPISFDSFSGTAINGVDYNHIPHQGFNFPANDTIFRIPIEAYKNNNINDKNIKIVLRTAPLCSQKADTIDIIIKEPPKITTFHNVSPVDISCQTDSIFLEVTPMGGIGDKKILWESLDTNFIIHTTPGAPQTFKYTITDECQTISDSILINTMCNFLSTSGDLNICPYEKSILRAIGTDSCMWSNGETSDSIIIFSQANDTLIYVDGYKFWDNKWWHKSDTIRIKLKYTLPNYVINGPPDDLSCDFDTLRLSIDFLDDNKTYIVTWEDSIISNFITTPVRTPKWHHFSLGSIECPNMIYDSVHVNSMCGFLSVSEDIYSCKHEEFLLKAHGADSCIWSNDLIGDSILAFTDRDTIFRVKGYRYWDNKWWKEEKDINIYISSTPKANGSIYPPIIPSHSKKISLANHTNNISKFIWYVNDNDSISNITPYLYENNNIDDSLVCKLIVYNDFCTDTAYFVAYIVEEHVSFPNAFKPDDNQIFKPFATNIHQIEYYIYNQWGALVFHTKDINYGWDGSFKGAICPPGNYVYIAKYSFERNPKTILTSQGNILLIK